MLRSDSWPDDQICICIDSPCSPSNADVRINLAEASQPVQLQASKQLCGLPFCEAMPDVTHKVACCLVLSSGLALRLWE